MSTVSPLRARSAPSPSKHNPFAVARAESTTFARKGILPSHKSPAASTSRGLGSQGTPAKSPKRSQWRMLWRGGLEIGPEGWRLDGVTFFALLTFPSTPTATPNPFAPPTPGASDPALPTNADLCLSLESMRGRKYLAVREVITLADEDVIDGEEAGIQMSSTSPLVSAYFASLFCREPTLSPTGRTKTAVVVGLGDQVDGADGACILIYGQRSQSPAQEAPTLKLCVGRKRPPPQPMDRKVRPGEPLPRAPPPPTFDASRRAPKRALSRASSMQALYQPPPGPSLGLGYGRLGEKGPRRNADGSADERKRRAGLIVPDRSNVDEDYDVFGGGMSRASSVRPYGRETSRAPSERGLRVPSLAPSAGPERGIRAPSVARSVASTHDGRPMKKAKSDSKQALENKGAIRKQAMHVLEERGYPRDGVTHKEVWPVAYKGTYFAFRNRLDHEPLDKMEIRDIVRRHLDMYLEAALTEEPEEAAEEGAAEQATSLRLLPAPELRESTLSKRRDSTYSTSASTHISEGEEETEETEETQME